MEKREQKRVYIEFDEDCVAARTNNVGQEFFSVTLPKGTIVEGEDFSNWNFTQTKMFSSKYHKGVLVASFPWETWEINLSHSFKDGDGEWQRETARVSAAALADAMARRSA